MRQLLAFTTFALTLMSYSGALGGVIKVACVGNSITYGAGVMNREKNSYPAQLQYFLGDGYEVRNFGANARTLLSTGDNPYTQTSEYNASQDFAPDVVLIKLGTNDTKPHNRGPLAANFKSEYATLIDAYRALPSHPRVILLAPVRCYLPEDHFSTEATRNLIIPALEALAYEKGVEIINLYSVFGENYEEHLMPDRLHPSSIGAGMLAQKIGIYLTQPRQEVMNLSLPWPYAESTKFIFFGYMGHDFNMSNGTPCKIIEPKQAASGNPWIWRARFWGHEPQTDIALLELGFHIVYCDVADLYGSPKAVARWNAFYREVAMPLGFAKKAALEGMSRGGLIVYNWAAANPDKVACIYADAPVLDFKSWPMGVKASKGSEDDTKILLKAYSFKNLEAALKYRHNPIDHATKLAKSGIPMLHVVGDADVVVPIAENTELFEATVKGAGGNISVIHKPGVGHHPHSLAAPQAIVDFILQHTHQFRNPCIGAVPGNEYRSGAGWRDGVDWHMVSDEITEILSNSSDLDVLLIGNSITQGFVGTRKLVVGGPGKKYADAAWGAGWFPAGISGDRIQNVLWRLENGNYETCTPRNVVITIGINNLYGGDTPAMVSEGIRAIAVDASRRFAGSRVYILGPLPAGKTLDSWLRKKFDATHSLLNKIDWVTLGPNLHYVNPTEWFTDIDGTLREGAYSGDDLHLSDGGYELWCNRLVELVK